MRVAKRVAALAAISTLGACTDFNDSWLGGSRANITAQYSVLDENFERIDLIAVLAGDTGTANLIRQSAAATAAARVPASSERVFPTGPAEVRIASQELSMAYAAFYQRVRALSEPAARLERNRIQDQIFGASQLACAIFKRNIRVQQEKSGFITGTATTVLGGLGALFTSTGTARALAGSAGIISGVGAEFRQAHFANLAAEVITAGIEAKRGGIYDQIDKRRHDPTQGSIALYSMENAVHDTIRYHAACAIDAGFEAAKDAIQLTRNPGLNEAANVIDRVQALRNRLDGRGGAEDVADPAASRTGRSTAAGTIAIGGVELGRVDLPLEVLSTLRQRVGGTTQAFFRSIETELPDLGKLDAYAKKDGKPATEEERLSALRAALSPIVDIAKNACVAYRDLIDAALAKDDEQRISSRMAARIAKHDGDEFSMQADNDLSKQRDEASRVLLVPMHSVQELWETLAIRLRILTTRHSDPNRVTAARTESEMVAAALKSRIDQAKEGLQPAPSNSSAAAQTRLQTVASVTGNQRNSTTSPPAASQQAEPSALPTPSISTAQQGRQRTEDTGSAAVGLCAPRPDRELSRLLTAQTAAAR